MFLAPCTPSSGASSAPSPTAPQPPAGRRRVGPADVGLAVVVSALLVLMVSPVNDIDVYWHVAVGQDLLRGVAPHDVGRGWLAVPAGPWTTSQWLAEVTAARLVEVLGWRGLLVARLAMGATAMAGTVWLVRRGGAHAVVALPFVTVTAPLWLWFTQDRPQTVSLLAFVPVAAWCADRLGVGAPHRPARPRLGRSVPVTAAGALVWAQVHGLWVLLPASMVLTAVLVAVRASLRAAPGRGRAAGCAREALPVLACAAASLTGLLNPLGVRSFTVPFTLSSAAVGIVEWNPPTVDQPVVWPWIAVVVTPVAVWALTRGPARADLLLWVAAWAGYGAMANRNLLVSTVFVLPVAVHAVQGSVIGRWAAAAGAPCDGVLERRLLRAGTALCLVAAVVGAGVRLATVDPLADTPALRIARRLATSSTPLRVFNAYNASGSLVAFGGGKVRLVVDGRADLWGAGHIDDVDTVFGLRPGWARVFADARPDAVVASATDPLTVHLLATGTWRVALHDAPYVLLLPVGAPAAVTSPG